MSITNSHADTSIPAPSTHDDHGSGPMGANPEALKAGHEPDKFYVKPILSIPFAVVVTFIIAFGVGTAVFAYAMLPRPDNNAHPAAVKLNQRPLNEELATIDRKGANGNPNVKSDNSRNEANQLLEENGQTITRLPLRNGYNSPMLHAVDVDPSLRPEKVSTLTTAAPGTVTINQALSDASGEKKATVIPTRKDTVKVIGSDRKPTGANAGRGPSPKVPTLPMTTATTDPKANPVTPPQPGPISPPDPKKP